MGWEKFWKPIERLCIVLGAIGGVAGGVFEAASYYRAPSGAPAASATPKVVAPAGAAAVSAIPPWMIWTFFALALLLIATGAAMMVIRLWPRRTKAAPTAHDSDREKVRHILKDHSRLDPLTLHQAAHLWCGEQPPMLASQMKAHARTKYLTLAQAAENGTLSPDLAPEQLPMISPHMNVRRAALKNYFEATGEERPDFLYAVGAPAVSITQSPPPPETSGTRFGPPLPKQAALLLEKPDPQSRITAHGLPLSVETFITIRNTAAVDLTECRLFIVAVHVNGEDAQLSGQFDPGGPKSGDYFLLAKFTERRLCFTRKNLADVVNEPPHQIPVEGGRAIEIGDNQRLIVFVKITSSARHVTLAELEIQTGSPEQISLSIRDQQRRDV